LLEGAAAFLHQDAPACLQYWVACDAAWRTREGAVQGWFGARKIDIRVARSECGAWAMNGTSVVGLEHCVDLDFGFTPATNLFPLRRLALEVGQGAAVPVAWLDAAGGALEVLQQHYQRRAADLYAYEAPRFNYAEVLQVGPMGFVYRYPRLWEAVPVARGLTAIHKP
jgi:hypothetical protein